MVLFAYDEKSILNSWTIRNVNYILMFIAVLGGFGNETDFTLSSAYFAVAPIVTAALVVLFVNLAITRTTFFEWDRRERKRKSDFVIKYTFVCSVLTGLMVSSICVAISIIKEGADFIVGTLFVLPSIYYAIQIPFLCTLYYPLFKDALQLSEYTRDKPKDWDG